MSGKAETTYDYRDEQNVLLYQAVRSDPKRFCQRRHNPAVDYSKPISKENPEWLWNLEGVRRVIYRLPELLALIKSRPDRWILIVEGERDVDTAMKHGLTATCNPMGAGKWDKSYSAFLKDCNIVVIPDEDPIDDKGVSPGCKHAEDVCNASLGIAKTVRVIRLPGVGPKGDLTEWWTGQEAAGVSVESRKKAIHELIKTATIWTKGGTILPVHLSAPKLKESSWDGEITPGLQAIAELTTNDLLAFKGMPTLSARLQIEIGHIAAALVLADKVDQSYLRKTLAAVGALAAKGIDELDKGKVTA